MAAQLVLEPAHVASPPSGPTKALRQTVEKRSYSRYCGKTSDETERNASGNSSRTISATRCSCSGFRNEKRKQTATDSTPASFSFLTCSRARLLVERDQYRPVLRDPLGNRQPVAAPDDRIALPGEILVVREVEGLLVAGDVEDVAVALGRDHPDLRAVVLDHDVRGDRRPVEHLVELVGWDAGAQRRCHECPGPCPATDRRASSEACGRGSRPASSST